MCGLYYFYAYVLLLALSRLTLYFVYGGADKNIPPAVLSFMAKRAHAVKTLAIPGASHVVMTSHPAEVAGLIEEAANAK